MQDDTLSDIRDVGTKKLIGYLPLHVIRSENADPHDLETKARTKGLNAAIFDAKTSSTISGALFVYDAQKLQEYIQRPPNKAVIEQSGWPTDVHSFVAHVVALTALYQTPLYDLIALAFNDQRPEYQNFVPYKGGPVKPTNLDATRPKANAQTKHKRPTL